MGFGLISFMVLVWLLRVKMVGVGDILSLLVDLLGLSVEMLSVDEWFFVFVLAFVLILDGFCSDSEEIVGGLKLGI